MERNELRTGNFVTFNNVIRNLEDIVAKVWAINKDSIQYGFKNHIEKEDHKGFKGMLCYLKPIVLTEEWLLNFGFKGSDIDDYFIELSNGNFFKLGSLDPIATNIFYVHQLQNLYFALTGKELS